MEKLETLGYVSKAKAIEMDKRNKRIALSERIEDFKEKLNKRIRSDKMDEWRFILEVDSEKVNCHEWLFRIQLHWESYVWNMIYFFKWRILLKTPDGILAFSIWAIDDFTVWNRDGIRTTLDDDTKHFLDVFYGKKYTQ